MARTSFAICLIFGMWTLGCERAQKGGGPSQPSTHASTFIDCPDPAHPNDEADWSGADMCTQEGQKDAHMALAAVKISKSGCPGIHIHHDQDFTLNISPLVDNGSCPANPFKKAFPYDSASAHSLNFHSDKAKDTAPVGCSYEIIFQPKSGTKCDPHIALGQ